MDELFPFLNKYMHSDCYQYVLCGYGISGALSSILAYFLSLLNIQYYYEYNIITYESAIPGNRGFSKYIQQHCNIYRYQNKYFPINNIRRFNIPGIPILLDNIEQRG